MSRKLYNDVYMLRTYIFLKIIEKFFKNSTINSKGFDDYIQNTNRHQIAKKCIVQNS